MVLVDSSIWIEWLMDRPLAGKIAPTMNALPSLIVPTIIQFEVAKWLERERSEDDAESFISLTTKCDVISLTTAIAMEAVEASRLHKLATADAIIYATALHASADLLTCDAHFKDLSHVIYLQK